MLVFIVADVTYDYVSTNSGYTGGDPVDTLWMLALAILFVAAACQLRAGPADELAAPPRLLAAGPSVLPYLAVLIGSNFAPGTFGRLAWALVQSSMIFLILAYSTHRRLQPWCPWCREGGGGDDEPATPDPAPDGRRQLI